ncbi:hypothetical protein [Mesorhizobium abyssinicae]|uniref:hypothetical protein n=1 Tax=Mesorhizobium abyssinicae TaxID=1209958 RepID=UPI00339576C1
MVTAILSIDEQVATMKVTWPQFSARRIDRRARFARWVGSVKPQYASYLLEIRYQVGSFPEVRVLSPELVRLHCNSEGQLPQVYPPAEDPTLCLFDPREREWTPAMTIASTTVPWALDWIALATNFG